ncbi:MAG TPA: ABC transporter permease subunit, partial [Candidatus Dormibacteraeota bacterium]|nr:ABC transporter permease subunit [Candidatus Dormibacteraeota bacterium]
MTGLAALLRKEMLESWRTRRLPVAVALFAVIGILSPLTARFLPEILKAALGEQLTIPIPTPTSADAIDQLQKNLGQFGAFTAIALAMGSVASEKERGTAAFILTKPASRASFLGAKLVVLGLVLLIATLVANLIAWAYTWVLFEPLPIGGWLAMAELAWLTLLVWGSVTFLASTVTRSMAAAAGLGFASLIGLSLLAAIPTVARFLPAGLDLPAKLLALGRVGDVDMAKLATA